MSMLGAGELCRAILEDADVARAFDLDTEGKMDLLATYMQAMEYSSTASAQLYVVSTHGHGLSASRSLSTLGVGSSSVFS
ncbi:MAG: hypothetical protein H7Y89_13570 [Steroidobacteraceae bacterium]|nr:hypothetical protein [Steroidobacteraceae bacterium]